MCAPLSTACRRILSTVYRRHSVPGESPSGLLWKFESSVRRGKIGAFCSSNRTVEHINIRGSKRLCPEERATPFATFSPNFGLADQMEDPWERRVCDHVEARERSMPKNAFLYLPISRWRAAFPPGWLLTMKQKGGKGAGCGRNEGIRLRDNFGCLSCYGILARETGTTPPQIATTWLFNKGALDIYCPDGSHDVGMICGNVEAVGICLREVDEVDCACLDPEVDALK